MENSPIENNGRKWQFWFLATFSLLLVITFVFYLPTRFERNFLREEAGHMNMEEMPHMDEEMMDMMHGDEHGGAVFHEEGEVLEGLEVNFNLTPVPVLAGSSTQLSFFVNEKPNNSPVPFSEIEINHTKLMHVIGVRSDLSEFFHIHPESSLSLGRGETLDQTTTTEEISPIFPEERSIPLPDFLTPEEHEKLIMRTEIEVPTVGVFSASYTFAKPGLYKIWSEVKKDGVIHSFGHPLFDVQGEGERERKEVSFTRNVVVGDYQVILEMKEPVAKGHEHGLSFDVHTLDGSEVALENYLGVPMHLAVIKDDLTQFIHTHPEEEGGHTHSFLPFVQEVQAHGEAVMDETVNFHVVFPEAGRYKVFAQFRPEGIGLPEDEALVASFWIQVAESAGIVEVADHHESTQLKPLVSPAWWFLLAVSLGLIVLLSIAVHKFITVRK